MHKLYVHKLASVNIIRDAYHPDWKGFISPSVKGRPHKGMRGGRSRPAVPKLHRIGVICAVLAVMDTDGDLLVPYFEFTICKVPSVMMTTLPVPKSSLTQR